MKILLHCDFDQQTITDHFGLSEYSYWFVFESYHIVLKEIFDVEVITDPAQADPLWEACDAAGVPCVLLSFNPPQKTPLGLSCPVIPVFAWEFPNIPRGDDERSWADDPRFDWEYVFRRVPGAITLSTHTVQAVLSALGTGFLIDAIPTPLWNRLESTRQDMAWRAFGKSRMLRLDAAVIDCDTLGLSLDGYASEDRDDPTPFEDDDELLLPAPANPASRPPHIIARQSGRADPLTLGPGEFAPTSAGWAIPPVRLTKTRLDGVVYTSVFTGSDERKNWADILTSFIWAFRDTSDAVLILKMGGAELIWQHQKLIDLLTRLSPFDCRVLVIYGYLNAPDYAQLIEATDFYVNASLCEGLCMPLMEYMSAGVPAIAPAHTAMADYINKGNAFVVAHGDGSPAFWPYGDRLVDRTLRPQINWQSLVSAYRESHDLIRQRRQDYSRMSANAVSSMCNYCDDETVKAQLRHFFSRLGYSSSEAKSTHMVESRRFEHRTT